MADQNNLFFNIFKNKKLVFILAGVLIILLASAGAAYYFFSSKSPRDFYLQAEGKNFKKHAGQIEQMFQDFYNYEKPFMDSRYKKRYEFTADIKSDSDKPFGINNAQAIFDIIKRAKLIVDSDNDPTGKKSMTRMGISLEKAPLIDASVYTSGRQMGFTVPVVLPDRYFTLNLDKLDEIYDRYWPRYNIPDIRPKRLFKLSDVAKTIKFDNQQLEGVMRDYGMIIKTAIEDQDAAYGEKIALKVGAEELSCKQVVITLSPDKTEKLFKDLVNRIVDDEVLLKLTYENYADVIKLLDEAAFFQVFEVLDEEGLVKLNASLKSFLETANIKKDLSGFKANIKKSVEGIKFSEGLKMTMVIDSSGNILDRKINTVFEQKDSNKTMLDIHTGSNDAKYNNFKNSFITLSLSNTSPAGVKDAHTISLSTNLTPTAKEWDEKGKVSLSYSRKKNSSDDLFVSLGLDIDKHTDELTLKRNNLIKYTLEFKGNDPGSVSKFDGNLDIVSWKNNKHKTRNSDTTFVISANIPSLGLKNTSLKLGIVKEDRLEIDDFALPQVSAADSVDLNNINEAGLIKVEDDMKASFGTFYLKNKPVIDAISGK